MMMTALALAAGVFAPAPSMAVLAPPACQPRPQVAAEVSGAGAVMRPQDWTRLRVRKLGDLPRANLEIAVDRSVGGCPAPVIIRYDVEGDGRAGR